MEKLTTEEIDAKCAELSGKLGVKVKAFVFITDDDEQIVGYLQEPTADAVLYLGDTMMQNNFSTGKEAILKDTLLKEESSPRIESKDRKNSRIYAAACREASNLFAPYLNEYKKK